MSGWFSDPGSRPLGLGYRALNTNLCRTVGLTTAASCRPVLRCASQHVREWLQTWVLHIQCHRPRVNFLFLQMFAVAFPRFLAFGSSAGSGNNLGRVISRQASMCVRSRNLAIFSSSLIYNNWKKSDYVSCDDAGVFLQDVEENHHNMSSRCIETKTGQPKIRISLLFHRYPFCAQLNL
jgi:hypothetical protein